MRQSGSTEGRVSANSVLQAETQEVVADFLEQIEQLYSGLIRYLERTSFDKTEPAAVSALLQQLRLLLFGLEQEIAAALEAGVPAEQLEDVSGRGERTHQRCHAMLQSRAGELEAQVLALSEGQQRQNAYLQHAPKTTL